MFGNSFKYQLTVFVRCLSRKMIATLTNTNFTTQTNTYLWWAKTGSLNGSAPVINAQNPDRERRTKEEYRCKTTTCLKQRC